jgi:hypothetical protein
MMARNDFRFDPVTEQFELLSAGARFGGTFDTSPAEFTKGGRA